MIISALLLLRCAYDISQLKIFKFKRLNKKQTQNEFPWPLASIEGDAFFTHDGSSIRFTPPAYAQRYAAIKYELDEFATHSSIKKVVDLGCSELNFFIWLKKIPGIEEIICVDVDQSILERCMSKVLPFQVDYFDRRTTPLKVKVLHGSAHEPDIRLSNANVIVAIELIEHLYPDVLEQLPYCLFGVLQPDLVLITTPNSDFNCVIPNFSGIRHNDHKFEWTQEQFCSWGSNLVVRYPDYTVQFKGIAPGPKGSEPQGCCTQMAVFTRKKVPKRDVEELKDRYRVLQDVEYPTITVEEKEKNNILYEVDYFLRNKVDRESLFVKEDQAFVPVKMIMDNIPDCNCSLERFIDILKTGGIHWNLAGLHGAPIENASELKAVDEGYVVYWFGSVTSDEEDWDCDEPVANEDPTIPDRPYEEEEEIWNLEDSQSVELSSNIFNNSDLCPPTSVLPANVESDWNTRVPRKEHSDSKSSKSGALSLPLEANFSVAPSDPALKFSNGSEGITTEPEAESDQMKTVNERLAREELNRSFELTCCVSLESVGKASDKANDQLNMNSEFGEDLKLDYTKLEKKGSQEGGCVVARCHSYERIHQGQRNGSLRHSLCWEGCQEMEGRGVSEASVEDLASGWSGSKGADSGYPESGVKDMDLDLTPEQVEEIMTENESEEDSGEEEGEPEPLVAPPLPVGERVENGDVANNNRDGEGNNLEGHDRAGEIEFQQVINQNDFAVPLMDANEPESDEESRFASAIEESLEQARSCYILGEPCVTSTPQLRCDSDSAAGLFDSGFTLYPSLSTCMSDLSLAANASSSSVISSLDMTAEPNSFPSWLLMIDVLADGEGWEVEEPSNDEEGVNSQDTLAGVEGFITAEGTEQDVAVPSVQGDVMGGGEPAMRYEPQ